jgi:DNA-binding transcriptional LysR family regulator
MSLDPALLRVLDTLLQTESVRETAVRLDRTQSAISHRLAVLREQLGDEILVKRGRGMVLTIFAYRIRPRVRAIMQAVDDLLSPEFSEPTSQLRRLRLPAQVDMAALFQASGHVQLDVLALLQILSQTGDGGPVEVLMPQ